MTNFRLIDPYPFQEQIFQAAWNKKPTRIARTISSAHDLAKAMCADHNDNSLSHALQNALKNCGEYSEAIKATPFLKDQPAIAKYKNNYKRHDEAKVLAALHSLGNYVPAGQVLFHGGPWLNSDRVPALNSSYRISSPLSTSLNPQVAAVHSHYLPQGSLWILTLTRPTPAFVFNPNRGKLKHEYEILLPPLELVCSHIDLSFNIPLAIVSATYNP